MPYNAFMENKSLMLIHSKIDASRWAKQWMYDTLPFNDYYKLAMFPAYQVEKLTGHTCKLDTINKISVYKNINNQHIAQVASFTKILKHKHKNVPERVTIATYYAEDERIFLINHLDAVGRTHANDYSIYPDKVRHLYEKYFTDEIVTEKDGKEYPLAYCPHFHFNTAFQTEYLGGQEKSNAISINQLIKYLKDLKNCKDEFAPILNNSLGMPFLTYLKQENKYKYNSLMGQMVAEIKNLYSNSRKHDLVNFMLELESIIKYKQATTNIENIIFDLKIMNRIIERYPNNYDLIAIFSNCLMKSINNKTKANELEVY